MPPAKKIAAHAATPPSPPLPAVNGSGDAAAATPLEHLRSERERLEREIAHADATVFGLETAYLQRVSELASLFDAIGVPRSSSSSGSAVGASPFESTAGATWPADRVFSATSVTARPPAPSRR